MDTNCHTCGRRLTPRLKSLLEVSAFGRPTFSSSPVAPSHTQPGPRKLLSAAGLPAGSRFQLAAYQPNSTGIHSSANNDILEACTSIPKQSNLPQTVQKISEERRNAQVQKTQKFPKMEGDFISRVRTGRIPPYINLHFLFGITGDPLLKIYQIYSRDKETNSWNIISVSAWFRSPASFNPS